MTDTQAAPRPAIPTTPEAGSADLELRDGRTGREYRIPITLGAIRATDLAKVGREDGFDGLLTYDPAFLNTASCRSAITFIDGDRGILRYRGYPIEELAGGVSFLDVAWLLIHGELPSAAGSAAWAVEVAAGSELPESVAPIVAALPRETHPMTALMTGWAAIGAHRARSRTVHDAAVREAELPRFLGSIGSLAGLVIRHRLGDDAAAVAATVDYGTSLWRAMFPGREPDPVLTEALEVLLVLQADHEQNCSTNAVRAVGSSDADPYASTLAGIAALSGPLHGGANEAVVRMLQEVGDVSRVPEYIASVKRGERRLMGFGHRVYKSYDPRARIIKATADRVFGVTGVDPLLEVAVALESVALSDPYFTDRRLYPNVDFYSGLIYQAMGLPADTFTVLFAVGRMAGWVAQWLEMMGDPDLRIARPRQIYIGSDARPVPARD